MIDIILPTYNRVHLIERCIDSILKQKSKIWHLTIIDDCSTDNTVELIRGKYLHDDRVTLLVKPENTIHPELCSGHGIKNTTGEYITVVDSDDWIEKDAIEKLYNFMIQTKADLVYSKKMEDFGSYKRLSCSSSPYFSITRLEQYCCIAQLCMYSRELFNRVGGFDHDIHLGTEWDLYLRMVESGAVVKHFPEVLYHITRTPGHVSCVMSNKDVLKQGIQLVLEKLNKRKELKCLNLRASR